MKFSIITATYNSGEFLEQAINSVLSQNHQDIEYIIIDGGSTDNTLSIIEKYRNRIAHIVSEKDNGIYDALNKGINQASGEVIGILHSDDFYTSNDVISNLNSLMGSESSDAAYADLYYVDRKDTSRIKRKWHSGSFVPNSFLFGWMPPHPTFFVRKKIYAQFGSFNLEFTSSADYELMLRFLYKHKIKVSYLDKYIVKMRMGGQSNVTVSNRLIANKEDRKAWKVNGLKPYFFTLWLKPLRKIFQFI